MLYQCKRRPEAMTRPGGRPRCASWGHARRRKSSSQCRARERSGGVVSCATGSADVYELPLKIEGQDICRAGKYSWLAILHKKSQSLQLPVINWLSSSNLVGPGRFELPTSAMSKKRLNPSNHLLPLRKPVIAPRTICI